MRNVYRYSTKPVATIPEKEESETRLFSEPQKDLDNPATASKNKYKKMQDSTILGALIFIVLSILKILFLCPKITSKVRFSHPISAVVSVIP